MYYCSLTLHIKDALAISGKPDNLNDLCTKAQALDLCYWECRDKGCYNLNTPSSSSAKSAFSTLPATMQSKFYSIQLSNLPNHACFTLQATDQQPLQSPWSQWQIATCREGTPTQEQPLPSVHFKRPDG
jgi:hypothetical protein